MMAAASRSRVCGVEERSVGTIWSDVRYAVRMMAEGPGFAAIAMLTLALGIGASAAIFSVIDGVLLDPFPYAHAERLVVMEIHDTDQGADAGVRPGVTAVEYNAFAGANRVFVRTAGFTRMDLLYSNGVGTERFDAERVAPGTFEGLGVMPMLGRQLTAEDHKAGAPPVFAMSYKAWTTRFGSDAGVVGRTFVMNGVPRTLVAVMPKRFALAGAEIWVPDDVNPANATTDMFFQDWNLIGGLKPGVTRAQAAADLSAIAHGLATEHPENYPKHFEVRVRSLAESYVGQFRETLFIVLAAVGLLLLIGCANVASLLMARATTREKEFAVRAALGASRGRLVRQMLIESFMLAAGGGVLGCLFASLGLTTLVAIVPPVLLPPEADVRMNGPVLLFALAVAVATAFIFGLAPALSLSARSLNAPLRESGKGVTTGARQGRVRAAVVALEVALSLTLLVGAGLLMRSFVALRAVHMGMATDHVLVIRLPLPEDRYKNAEQVGAFFRPLLPRIAALPGVVDVAETSTLPPYGGIPSDVDVPGKTHSEKWSTLFELVSTGYLPTLKIGILAGRNFNAAEEGAQRKVAVVNQTFAKRYLSGGGTDASGAPGVSGAIGQRFHLSTPEKFPDPVKDAWFEVVGVAADAKNSGVENPAGPEVWLPYTITGSGRRGVMIRTSGDPLAMMNAVRGEIWAVDSSVALTMSDSLENYIHN